MRIFYDDPQTRGMVIDRERFRCFLEEQQLPTEAIHQLNIRFQWRRRARIRSEGEADQLLGLYNGRYTIYIYIHRDATIMRLTRHCCMKCAITGRTGMTMALPGRSGSYPIMSVHERLTLASLLPPTPMLAF